MAAPRRQRDDRAARERSRAYQARQQFHRDQLRRRRRDNVVAGVAGGLLIAAVIAGQTAYFVVGPGSPSPAVSVAPTPTGPLLPIPSQAPAQ